MLPTLDEPLLRLPTEADLDRAEREMQQRDEAEARLPLPGDVDLFGDKVLDEVSRRRMQSARNQLSYCRRKYALVGINPLDVIMHNIMRWQAEGDFDKATAAAIAVAPYFAPRLSAVAMQVPAAGGGVIRFTWEGEATPVESEP